MVVDDRGYPDFQMLQDYRKSGKGHLLYYVFDILHFEGHDMTNLPLLKRKELLEKVLPAVPKIRFSDHVWKDGTLFFNLIKEKGLEGVIAKHGESVYLAGGRESTMAQSEGPAHARGRDRRIYSAEGTEEAFRVPSLRRIQGRRVGLHRPQRGRIQRKGPGGNPRETRPPDPEGVSL